MSTEQQEVVEQVQCAAELSAGAKTSTDIASLGKCLQQARIQAGYSVAQIASEMHLEARFIEFIERDRFRELGAPVFVKGHLRRYARLVNVDEALLQGLYESLRDPPVAADPIPVSMNSVPEQRKLVPGWMLWAAASVFVVVSIVTIMNRLSVPGEVYATTKTSTSLPVPVPVQVEAQPTIKPVADAVGDSVARDSSLPGKSTLILASVTPVATANAHESNDEVNGASRNIAPGHVALTLRFTGDSWVEVYDANKHSIFQTMGHNSNVHNVDGVAPLRVVLGSAPQVNIHVNGRAVVIPARRIASSVARFTVDANGVIN
jgi:cytoskeleton protein RodZ